MTNLSGLTLAAPVPVAGLASDVTLDSIAQGSDITTNNVTINKHGLCPKLPSDATKYLDGTGAYTVPAGGGGGGVTELAYVEFSSSVTVSATSEATADSVVSAGALSFNGTTRAKIEFSCYTVAVQPSALVVFTLYDGSSSIGRLAVLQNPDAVTQITWPVYLQQLLTPSNASHTYSIRAYRITTNCTVIAGAGGVGNPVPGFIRVTSGS